MNLSGEIWVVIHVIRKTIAAEVAAFCFTRLRLTEVLKESGEWCCLLREGECNSLLPHLDLKVAMILTRRQLLHDTLWFPP